MDASPGQTQESRQLEHYSGIRAHPDTVGGWVVHVFAAGMLQALLIGVLSNIAGVFILLALPVLMMIDPVIFTYIGVIVGFVLGSAYTGYVLPHYAFYRSAASFLLITTMDVVRVNCMQQPGMFVGREYEFVQVIPFALFGALVCAFAGSLGSRWNRGFGQWLEDEWMEFMESIGVLDDDDGYDDGCCDDADAGNDDADGNEMVTNG